MGTRAEAAAATPPERPAATPAAPSSSPPRGGRPRRRPHGATVLVLGLGLLVTTLLAVIAWAARDRNEDRLLHQRVREAAAVLESALPSVETPLASAAEVAEMTDGDVEAFTQLLAPHVGVGRRFVSASLWRLEPIVTQPIAVVGAPPVLAVEPQASVEAFLVARSRTRPPDAPRLSVLDLLERPEPRLGYSFTSPRTPARFVAYAESALPPDRRSVAQRGTAFADLEYALYLGARVSAEGLVVASTDELPLRGRTARTTVRLGDADLHLVISPRGNLGGGLMAALPWLIVATGLLVTAGAALFTERLLRSRDHAERLADELGRVAEENARLYAEQRTVAQTLQENLLPQELPVVDDVEIGVRYEAGVHSLDVGGDWYDVIETGDGRLVFVVGDVSGRGLPAATIMASLRHAIRAYAVHGDEPAQILSRLAPLLSVARDGHFATVLCGELDPGRREVTLASAGHPNPLLIDDAGATFVEVPVGVPVGTFAAPAYRSVTVPLPPRATLLLFTDGLFERRGETLDRSLERLRLVAAGGDPRGRPLDTLLTRVLDGLAEGRGSDDTAILALRWRG